jgi:hypothetical protein
MPPNIPEWRKQQLNTRSSDEAAGKIKEAAKWWWGDNPKDIATQAVQDYLLFGAARKGLKLVKKGGELAWNSKAVKDLINKSNQHGDEIVNRVQSKWDNLFPQTVPDATVTITKKTKPLKKKTQKPKPKYDKGKKNKRIQPTPTGKKGRERRMYN